MKNVITIFLLLLSLCLAACGNVSPEKDSSSEPQEYRYLQETEEAEEHTHEAAETPQTVSDPISGYCGNLVTKIVSAEGEQSFWGDDSVTLTDIVINLDYQKDTCDCIPEFNVYIETESQPYGVNLADAYVRYEGRQADLTEEQVNTIRSIYDRQFLSNLTREIQPVGNICDDQSSKSTDSKVK